MAEPQPEKFDVYLDREPLDRGGYDSSGRYWGRGAPLWAVSAHGEHSGWIDSFHIRALSRGSAKQIAIEELARRLRRPIVATFKPAA